MIEVYSYPCCQRKFVVVDRPPACSPECLTVDGDPGRGGAEYGQYDSIFYFGGS